MKVLSRILVLVAFVGVLVGGYFYGECRADEAAREEARRSNAVYMPILQSVRERDVCAARFGSPESQEPQGKPQEPQGTPVLLGGGGFTGREAERRRGLELCYAEQAAEAARIRAGKAGD